MDFQAELPALLFKIRQQRRTHGVRTELPRLSSGGKLRQNPQSSVRGNAVLSFYKRRQRAVPKLIDPRTFLSPEGRQTLRHGKSADLIVSRYALLFSPCLLSRRRQKMQQRILIDLFRLQSGLQPLPDLMIKAGRLHAAGIAVQSVCRLHGISHGIDRLQSWIDFVKPDRSSFKAQPRSILSFLQQLPQAPGMEASRHHQNSAVLPGSPGDLLRHIPFPQKTAVLRKLLLRRIQPGQAAV